MIPTSYTRHKARDAMLLLGAGMLAGPLFVVFAHGFEDLFRYVNALLIGVLIAVCSIFFELYIFDRYFKKLPFYLVLLARSGFYFSVVILVSLTELTVARIIRNEQTIAGVWASEEFQDYLSSEYPYVLLYAFALVAAVNFTRQMVRKVGYDVMLNLIGGKYYKPVFENRIFMFLSLTEPHQLAEKLGGIHFHKFLNDFIFDITQPILANHGEIYQYVEDEIVVTWKEQNGLKNNRWFRAYHEAKQALEEAAPIYLAKYGTVPEFRAAYHCGRVVRGEIGDIKTDMVFHGDVLNTTARILELGLGQNKDVLITSELIKKMEYDVQYTPQLCGTIRLRGKKDPVELHCINNGGVPETKNTQEQSHGEATS